MQIFTYGLFEGEDMLKFLFRVHFGLRRKYLFRGCSDKFWSWLVTQSEWPPLDHTFVNRVAVGACQILNGSVTILA